MAGFLMIALAMAIRCFCPPDNITPRSPTMVSQPLKFQVILVLWLRNFEFNSPHRFLNLNDKLIRNLSKYYHTTFSVMPLGCKEGDLYEVRSLQIGHPLIHALSYHTLIKRYSQLDKITILTSTHLPHPLPSCQMNELTNNEVHVSNLKIDDKYSRFHISTYILYTLL